MTLMRILFLHSTEVGGGGAAALRDQPAVQEQLRQQRPVVDRAHGLGAAGEMRLGLVGASASSIDVPVVFSMLT